MTTKAEPKGNTAPPPHTDDLPPPSQSIRLDGITALSATRAYNAEKKTVVTTVTIKAHVAAPVADYLMELAAQRVPLHADVGTDQGRLFDLPGAGNEGPGEPEED
jgi:hypothetical protein